ncbi:MAG: hypothetical protein JEY79_03640 [Pseudodesulfovibrio sp.]|nr:hypothetical protein [Pseudodesulfovibrio sp.]
MGSPSARLNTPEKLRPWLESGLQYVFNPGQTHVAQQPSGTVQMTSGPGLVQSEQAPVQSPQPVSQARTQPDSSQSSAGSGHPAFPEPWAKFLGRVPAAPKVVWTYMELGLDLGGQADPKRGAVLRNIINHLKWPKGTTAFWPVAALSDGALQPHSQMFWKGWELWHTPYIACFGEEALQIIYPEAEPGNTTYLLEHVTIFVLPPLSKLIPMLPHEQQMSVDSLMNVRL